MSEERTPAEALAERVDSLEKRGQEIVDRLEGDNLSKEDAKGLRSDLEELQKEHRDLMQERDARLRDEEKKALQGEVKSLKEAVEDLRKPHDGFDFAGGGGSSSSDTPIYGPDSEHSFYADVKASRGGDTKARERLESVEYEGKALTEDSSTGGFLVPPQISTQLIDLRFQRALLRGLFSSVSVSSNKLEFTQMTSGLLAGWVAELAEKPESDFTFAQLDVGVFTAAGLGVVSNQLLQDSVANVDALINADLAARLAIVEEVAFIKGTGNGQPLGILNTPGVDVVAYTDSTPTQVEFLDKLQDAITAVHTDFFAPPSAVVMHPRRWAWLVKARESASPTSYIIGPPGASFPGRRPADPIPGYSAAQTPRGELFGLPVYTTANVPTNLGSADNEDVVFVGDFSQGLILDRQGITTDQSPHVYFTSNQTVFRSEERLGFTAARYPNAFKVVAGTGLVTPS